MSASLSGSAAHGHGRQGHDSITVVCRDGAGQGERQEPADRRRRLLEVSEVDVVAGAGNDRVDLSGVGPDSASASAMPGGFGHGTGAAADLGARQRPLRRRRLRLQPRARRAGRRPHGRGRVRDSLRAAAATTPSRRRAAVTSCSATPATTSSTGAPTTTCSAATPATTSSSARPEPTCSAAAPAWTACFGGAGRRSADRRRRQGLASTAAPATTRWSRTRRRSRVRPGGRPRCRVASAARAGPWSGPPP